MFRNFLFIALLFVSLASAKKQHHVAVLTLEGVGISETESRILTNKLRTELVKSGEYVVLDRGEMDNILKEQGHQQTGCFSSECAVEIGQILGMSHIVTGSIGKLGELFYVEIKLINVETSKIEKAVDTHIKGTVEALLIKALPYLTQKMISDSPIHAESLQTILTGNETVPTSTKAVPVKKTKTGSLSIDVSPNYSALYINDSSIGQGDKELTNLKPGRYKVTGKYRGLTTVRYVDIEPEEATNIDINVKPMSLYIEVEPDWAELFINGRSYGRGDCELSWFTPGTHKVELRTRNDRYEKDMVVYEGGEQEFEIEMPGY